MELQVTYGKIGKSGHWTGDVDVFLAEQNLDEFLTRRIQGLKMAEMIRVTTRLDTGEAVTFKIERTA